MTKEVIDLRSALELLQSIPGQMVHTDVEVDPSAELAAFIVMWVQAALLPVLLKQGRL